MDDRARLYSELFERHAQAIYGFCVRRTGDAALAEDLTSIVFLEAWRRRDDVDLDTRPALPWLFGVATNVLRNQRRTQLRHRAALGRLGPLGDTPDRADETAARIDAERAARQFLPALKALPRREREVLALCWFTELTYSEVADALGIPIGTVRSRAARGRARIPVPKEATTP
jgi:RNA polymerase sigma-70 factor (ECF subfamily)